MLVLMWGTTGPVFTINLLVLRRKIDLTTSWTWKPTLDFIDWDNLSTYSPSIPIGTGTAFTANTETIAATGKSYSLERACYTQTAGLAPTFEQASISGGVAVHQFCRIGGGALISGNAVITEDVPPNALAHGRNLISGLNLVGLRRRAVPTPAVAEIKKAYHAVYATHGACATLAQKALSEGDYQTLEARDFLNFFLGGKRGRFVSPE
jgi:hypothetical protein